MNQPPAKDFYNFTRYCWTQDTLFDHQPVADASVLVLSKPATDEEQALLHKILQAIHLDIDQQGALLMQPDPVAYKFLMQYCPSCKILLLFGFQPADLGLHLRIPPYKLVTFQDTQLLFSGTLSKIATNARGEKMALWQQLQQLDLPEDLKKR